MIRCIGGPLDGQKIECPSQRLLTVPHLEGLNAEGQTVFGQFVYSLRRLRDNAGNALEVLVGDEAALVDYLDETGFTMEQ